MLPTFPANTTYNDLLCYFVETKYEADSREQTNKTIKATFKKLTGYSINAKVEDTDLQLVIDTLSNAKIPHCTFAAWLKQGESYSPDTLEAASYEVMMADALAKTELLETVLENMGTSEVEDIEQLKAIIATQIEDMSSFESGYWQAVEDLEVAEQRARDWELKYKELAAKAETKNSVESPKTIAELESIVAKINKGITWGVLLPQISSDPSWIVKLRTGTFRVGSLRLVDLESITLLISIIEEQLTDCAFEGQLHLILKQLYQAFSGKEWVTDFRSGRPH